MGIVGHRVWEEWVVAPRSHEAPRPSIRPAERILRHAALSLGGRPDDRASEDARRDDKPGPCSRPTKKVNRASDRVGRPHTLLIAAIILGACARPPSGGIPNDADATLDADAVIEDATAVIEDAMADVLAETPRDVFVDAPPDVRYLRCADLERVYGCRGTIRMCFPDNPNGDVGPCDEPTPYPSCVGSTGGPYCRTGDEAWDWRCQCNPTSLSNRVGVWSCKVRVVCNGDASVWPR